MGYGHYAAECKKTKRDRELKEEANFAQMQDDEPALLFTEGSKEENKIMLINEEKVKPRLNSNNGDVQGNSNLWYLDNGANNHMTGQLSKFRELDEKCEGKCEIWRGVNRSYQRKRKHCSQLQKWRRKNSARCVLHTYPSATT